MYIESIYHTSLLNRLHRHNQMSVLRLSIPRSDRSHSAKQFYLLGRLHFARRRNRTEQNMASTRFLSQAKVQLSVLFDENAFDEVTFRRTGNSTKTFDEVSL